MDKEKLICQNCSFKRKGGLCTSKNIYVARKKEACENFKKKG